MRDWREQTRSKLRKGRLMTGEQEMQPEKEAGTLEPYGVPLPIVQQYHVLTCS